MTTSIYLGNKTDRKPALQIGPRVACDIRRRIRELDQRIPSAMTSGDRRELSRLRSMLELISTVPGGDRE